MYGLSFEERVAVPPVEPRADIALFVGWCAWRSTARVDRDLARWFDARFALPIGSAHRCRSTARCRSTPGRSSTP
jgi:hypothetical protein